MKTSHKLSAVLPFILLTSGAAYTQANPFEGIGLPSLACDNQEYKHYFLSGSTRSIDGSQNNLLNPTWGATNIGLLRNTETSYKDGLSIPIDNRPHPRDISNILFKQEADFPNSKNVTSMMFQWGQFLDHDIDLSPERSPEEDFSLIMPGDQTFPVGSTLKFTRSDYVESSGTDPSNPRQQLNAITAFIDASNVYGSDSVRANTLRTLDGTGKLKVSEHKLLPFNTYGLSNAGGDHNPHFMLAGDVRANEQVGLIAMHILFVREHNRLSEEIQNRHPNWCGDSIYELAKAIVGAQMQVITYKEFLPLLLGEWSLLPYSGYKPYINPSIANEFSTAAYRFGHSLIPSSLKRLDENGASIDKGDLLIRNSFFNPNELNPVTGTGLEPLLRGLTQHVSQEVDSFIVSEIRDFLFLPPRTGGVDLAVLNIQRGRDHGLSDYNTARQAYNLPAITNFSDISSNPYVYERLEQIYGTVDNIDLWVGILAEDHAEGAMIGELGKTIIGDQFLRLRDGDRFWYQHMFTGSMLLELENTTLTEIIERNTKIQSSEIGFSAFTLD